jgi:cell wall assembly regulator SMI1
MADSTRDQTSWLRELHPRTISLRPPASEPEIRDAEAALRCFLPADYRRFLTSSDGR